MPDFVLSPELEATRPQAAMYVGDSGETTSSWVGRQVERLNKVEGDDSSADFKQLFRRRTLFDFVNVLEGKSSVWNADVTSEDRAAMTAAVERIQPQILEAAAAPVAAAPVAATDIPVPASAEIPKTAAPAVQTLDPQTLEVARALNARVESEGWDRVGVGFITENFPALDRPAAETVFANLQKAGILGEQVDNGVFGPANLINRDALQAAVVPVVAEPAASTPAPVAAESVADIRQDPAYAAVVKAALMRSSIHDAPLFVRLNGPGLSGETADDAVAALQKDGVLISTGSEGSSYTVNHAKGQEVLAQLGTTTAAPATEEGRYTELVTRLQPTWRDGGQSVIDAATLVRAGYAQDADEAGRFIERLQKDGVITLMPEQAEAFNQNSSAGYRVNHERAREVTAQLGGRVFAEKNDAAAAAPAPESDREIFEKGLAELPLSPQVRDAIENLRKTNDDPQFLAQRLSLLSLEENAPVDTPLFQPNSPLDLWNRRQGFEIVANPNDDLGGPKSGSVREIMDDLRAQSTGWLSVEQRPVFANFANPNALVQIEGVKPAAPAPVEDPLVPYAVRAVDALRKKGETELEPEVFLNELRAQPGLPVPPDSVDRTRAASLLDTLEKQKHVGEEGLFGYRDILSDPANPAPAGAPLPATEDDRYKDAVKRLQENWYQKGETVTVTPDQLVTYGMANDADEAKRFVQRLQDDKIVGAPNEAGEHIILEPKKAAPEAAPVVAAPVAEGQDPLYARAVQVVDEMHAKGTAQVSPMTLLQDLQRQPDLPASDQPLDVKRSKALLEAMEQNGVVGPADGIGWRDIVAPEKRPAPAAPELSEEQRYEKAAAWVDSLPVAGIREVSPTVMQRQGYANSVEEADGFLNRMEKAGSVGPANESGRREVVPVDQRNPVPEPTVSEEDKRYNAASRFVDESYQNGFRNASAPWLVGEGLAKDEAEAKKMLARMENDGQIQGPDAMGQHPIIDPAKRKNPAPEQDDELGFEPSPNSRAAAEKLRRERQRAQGGGQPEDPNANGNDPEEAGTSGKRGGAHFSEEQYKKLLAIWGFHEYHVRDHEHTNSHLKLDTLHGDVTITNDGIKFDGKSHAHESYRAGVLSAQELWGGGTANGRGREGKAHQIMAVAYGQAYGVDIKPKADFTAADWQQVSKYREHLEHHYGSTDPVIAARLAARANRRNASDPANGGSGPSSEAPGPDSPGGTGPKRTIVPEPAPV